MYTRGTVAVKILLGFFLIVVAVFLFLLPRILRYTGLNDVERLERGQIYNTDVYTELDPPTPDFNRDARIEKIQTEVAAANQENSNDEPIGGYFVQEFARGLTVPWSMDFTHLDRMLVTERGGAVRQVVSGVLEELPVHTFSEVSSQAEEGLMGLAIDPQYESNQYVYFSLAYKKGNDLVVKVVRFADHIDELKNETIIIDDIPAARFHAGSRIAFGPDQKLYITTGDATDKNIAQDLDNLGGKILRINADGSIPSDNPFPGNPVWSFGHRNSQGIDWHPQTLELYSTEHGPSVFDGPAGGDEVNRIVAGANYGWPLVSHEDSLDGTVEPLLVFTPAEAPGSGVFYQSDVIPEFTNQFFFGALKGEGIIRVFFDTQDPDRVIEFEKLSEVNFGRIRAIVEGPDGALYFATSNRDGRGSPRLHDDRIFRIIPNQ